MTVCASCGHANEDGARFCSACGRALTEARSPERFERKVVTVVFADLVGFTARAERLDPEDVKAVLEPYHARLRSELERFGGTVEKFIGDAVMALFGAPVAHEDDPERAVRAALAIRDWIEEEGTLQVRIGVNTGEAIVNLDARPERGEGMAAGDIVNAAARIQAAAPANGILVGESTSRATAQAIDYHEPTTIEAKGKEEPVAVREVVQARSRFGVDMAPRTRAPLVGRERELEVLRGALSRARQQRSLELVTLVGVPGIGKSRLVAELFASIERNEDDTDLVYWRQGRSLPYGEGISYWALSEMVKAQAGILETDGAEAADAKLERTLEGVLDEDVEWVHSHLRPLIGQATALDGGAREEAFAAWRRFFEALAEQRPLVLVFEDVQWADEGLLDFVEHLVDWVRDVPLLVVCTARLDLLERRPSWGGGKLNAATLALAPLTADETARLIAALSERPLLPSETQVALLERAGGNPLYAEQYVRMLAERDAADQLPLPESVQGIIAARLDALPREEKGLLQGAAVIGKVFWLGGLAAVRDTDGELEQRLHSLERKEFVQRARRPSVAGETEFAFRHLLVRDVAYGQVPRAVRADMHRRTAEWIESLGRPEDHAEMVAHHYLSALELSRAAGREVGDLSVRARTSLGEAGRRATALSAFDQAERYLSAALDLTSPGDPARPDLVFRLGRVRYLRDVGGADLLEDARDLLAAAGDHDAAAEAALMLADISWQQGLRDEALRNLAEAGSLVADTAPSRARARVLSETARYAMLDERVDDAIRSGREALQLAEELGLDDLRAHALNSVGTARTDSGDMGGLSDLEESIAIAARVQSAPDLLRGHNNLSVVYVMLGDFERARAEAAETLRLAQNFGYQGYVRFLRSGPLLGIAFHTGSWDEVGAGAEAFLEEVGGGSLHYHGAAAHHLRGLIRVGRGDVPGAEADIEEALEAARLAKDPQIMLPALAVGAFVFELAGRRGRALELATEALGRFREKREAGFALVWSFGLAWVSWTLGLGDELLEVFHDEPVESPWLEGARAVARGEFLRAADVYAEIGATSAEAFFRLKAAGAFVERGDRRQADEQLGRALAFFRSVGATRFVREGERLLAASA